MASSTWDWPVSKRNSANSSAHSGRFFGFTGNSSWMLAWAIGLPIFPPPGVRPEGGGHTPARDARADSSLFSVSVTGTSCNSAIGTVLARG